MTRNKYTSTFNLRKWESDRHLANLSVERSDAVLQDYDVQQVLDSVIEDCSRDFDGYLRGHLDVPFEDSVSSLTGVLTFTNGSTAVTAVGGAFLTELVVGDRIILDSQEEAEGIVQSITDDNALVLHYEYYGAGGSGAGSKIVSTVPAEIEILTRGHVLYTLWARRGRLREENPHKDKESMFEKRIPEFQSGRFRIKTATDDEVAEKPARFNTDAKSVMTDSAFSSYTDPTYP